MMKITKYAWAFTLLTLIAGLIAFLKLPPEATIPLHWDIDGNINRETAAHGVLFIIPAIQAIVIVLFSVVLAIEPRQENIRKSIPAIQVTITSVVILLTLVQFILISKSFNIDSVGINALIPAAGLLFIITGNYMTKLRSGFFVGLRTPWTLSSDYVWKKTHRLGGRLFMLSGLIILSTDFFYDEKIMSIIIVATTLAAAFIPVIYSWIIWRREKANGNQQPS